MNAFPLPVRFFDRLVLNLLFFNVIQIIGNDLDFTMKTPHPPAFAAAFSY